MVQHFSLRPRGTLRRSKLMNASIDVMAYMLSPLGSLLMCLDAGVPGMTAGPSFELAQPVRFISDHTVAQRQISRSFTDLAAIACNNRYVPSDVTKLLVQYADYTKTLE
jgi:hypothetical protein